MRWTRGNVSRNIDDRRFRSGGMRRPGGAKIGLGGLLALLLLSFVFKQDLLSPFLGVSDNTMVGAPTNSAPASTEE